MHDLLRSPIIIITAVSQGVVHLYSRVPFRVVFVVNYYGLVHRSSYSIASPARTSVLWYYYTCAADQQEGQGVRP